MSDLPSESKLACRGASARPERARIAEGPSTSFHEAPSHAPVGTIALAGGDAVVIVNERK